MKDNNDKIEQKINQSNDIYNSETKIFQDVIMKHEYRVRRMKWARTRCPGDKSWPSWPWPVVRAIERAAHRLGLESADSRRRHPGCQSRSRAPHEVPRSRSIPSTQGRGPRASIPSNANQRGAPPEPKT